MRVIPITVCAVRTTIFDNPPCRDRKAKAVNVNTLPRLIENFLAVLSFSAMLANIAGPYDYAAWVADDVLVVFDSGL